MLSAHRIVRLIAVGSFLLTSVAQASDTERLSTVAAANGYTYQWMTTEAGATLLRPGVHIVIRAGRLLYEVNDATPIADTAPRFDGRDLVISQRLADHLREIAHEYPYPAAEQLPQRTPVTGALTIRARQIPGRDALALQGTGPAGVPVTITLYGQLSTDLPVVRLTRKTVLTATDGTFFAEATYGQDAHINTFIAATATSVDGVAAATARVKIGNVSPNIVTPGLDVWPAK